MRFLHQGDTVTFRNLARFPGIAKPIQVCVYVWLLCVWCPILATSQGFVLLRFDANLCFANCLLFNVSYHLKQCDVRKRLC